MATQLRDDDFENVRYSTAFDELKNTFLRLNDPAEIAKEFAKFLSSNMSLDNVRVYLWNDSTGLYEDILEGKDSKSYPIFNEFILWLSERSSPVVSWALSNLKESIQESAKPIFEELKSEIVIPQVMNSSLLGFVSLGEKENGYSSHDMARLIELNQVTTIALSNGIFYKQLVKLTETLEAKVRERTKELQDAQAQLVMNEKLASLGVMIAGIAHEVNTPSGVIKGSADNLEENMIYTFTHLGELEVLAKDPKAKKAFTLVLFRLVRDTNKKRLESKEIFKLKKETKEYFRKKGLKEEDASELSSFAVEYNTLEYKDHLVTILQRAGKGVFKILKSGVMQNRNIKNIKYSITQIVRIVKALKYHSHSGQHASAPADIIESLENTLIIVQSQFKHRVKFFKEFEETEKVVCNIDELNQVWTNLLVNAIHASREFPDPEIVIRYYRKDPEHVRIEFEDNGSGIPETIKEKIWDPFFTTKDQGEGTGLGLGIVKGIIDKHKGSIEVESVPRSTVFKITLPFHAK